MNQSSRQRINKGRADMYNTIDLMDIIDISRTFYPTATENTFFSNAHWAFSRIDHMLSHKANLTKFKNIEIILCIFSDHSGMKLWISNRRKSRKFINTWKLTYSWKPVSQRNQGISKYLETNESGNTTYQNTWEMTKAVLKGKFIVVNA